MVVGNIKQHSLETNWGPCHPLEKNEQKNKAKSNCKAQVPAAVAIGGEKREKAWEGKESPA